MCLAFLTKILILNLNALYQKKKVYTTTDVTKQKKKFDSHRTDQRYHPTWKGLGLGLPFFKMVAVLCLEC